MGKPAVVSVIPGADLDRSTRGPVDAFAVLTAVRDPDGVLIDFEFRAANDALCAHLLMPRTEVVGQRLTQVQPETTRENIALYERVIDTGEPLVWNGIELYTATPGPIKYVDFRCAKVGDGISLTFHDVSMRTLAHRESSAVTRDRLQADDTGASLFTGTAERGAIGTATLDSDGRFLGANPTLCRMLGRSPEDLRRIRWQDLAHAADPAGERMFADLWAGRRDSYRLRQRYRGPDRSWSWLDLTVGRAPGWSGGADIAVAQVVDVTAQVREHDDLLASERQYRLLAENASDVVSRDAHDGVIEFITSSVEVLLGWHPGDVIGLPFASLIHPDDVAAVAAAHDRVAAGESASFKARVRKRDGGHRWLAVFARPVLDAGTVVGRINGWRDVHTETRAQRQLARREAQLRTTLDAMLDPHVVMRPLRRAGRVVDWLCVEANRVACQELGIERSLLVDHRVSKLLPALADTKLPRIFLDVLKHGEPQRHDSLPLTRDADGNWRVYDLRAARMDDLVGCTWRDVTGRYRTAQAIERLAQERSRLIGQLPVGVFGVKDTGDGWTLQFVSDRARVLLNADLVDGSPAGEAVLAAIHPDDVSALKAQFFERLTSREPLLWEGRTASPGELRWLRLQGAFTTEPDGTALFEGIVQDITDAKAQETALIESRIAAERAAAAKSAFLANMSHEIRTPLTAVLGLLRLLGTADLAPAQHEYAARAERAAQSLLSILNDILDFSKMEAGSLILDRQPMVLERLLGDVGVVLAANLAGKPLDLIFDIDPDIPPTLIADELRLRQVLLNLAGNAIKFTETGEVVLAARLVERRGGEAVVEVSVRDTGIGMPAEALERVFDDFTQAEGSIARRYGGTGLGLTISRRLVQLMGGGDLTVTSRPGHGSTFTFRLHAAVAEPAEPAPDPLPGLRALVVSASASMRAALARLGAAQGWTMAACHPDDATALLSGPDTPDVDVILADRAADVVHAGCQAADPVATPLVVALTAQPGDPAPVDPGRPHVDVVKPFTATGLLTAITRARRGEPDPVVAAPESRTRLSGIRVLLAEDNDINREVIITMLEREGAVMTAASDGVRAIAAVAQAQVPFDVILMDIQMPELDGLAASRAIRARGSVVPILAMTAHAMAEERQACLDAGLNDYIRKPFDHEDLVTRVLDWAGRCDPAPPEPDASRPPHRDRPAALSPDAGLARVAGDRDFYARVLRRFAAGLPAAVAGIDAGGSLRQVISAAHSLRGAAATVGADACAHVAGLIEQDADDPVVLAGLRADLADAVTRTLAAIDDWLDTPA